MTYLLPWLGLRLWTRVRFRLWVWRSNVLWRLHRLWTLPERRRRARYIRTLPPPHPAVWAAGQALSDLLDSNFLKGTGMRAFAIRAARDRLAEAQRDHDCPYTWIEVLGLVRSGRKRSKST